MAKQAAKKKAASPASPITATATLRARARKNIDDGAITDSYAADRKVVIRMLNDALATEYVCVLRYYRHYFMAKGMLADSVKAEFLEHAQQEQAHAGKLAERIAIDSYREMINYVGDRDTTTKRILEGILAQEEEHADEFSDLLDGWIG
jgi:bacterioferritin